MIRLKVGRSVDLVKRLNEWQRECESKEQIVRGWWPGKIMDKNFETSLLKGRVQSGPRGKYCHKLERLVHLELADLVVHAPYLNKNFPNVSSEVTGDEGSSDTTRSKPGTPSKNGKRNGGAASSAALNSLQQGNDPCPDCECVLPVYWLESRFCVAFFPPSPSDHLHFYVFFLLHGIIALVTRSHIFNMHFSNPFEGGKFHKEIFPFTRPEDGPLRDHEWEKLVEPVIEKWGWFVETLA